MTNKNLKKIFIIVFLISIIINIVFGISEFMYRTTKKELKNSISVVEGGVNDIKNIISTNVSNVDDIHTKTIDGLIKYYEDDSTYKRVIGELKGSNEIRIHIGTETFKAELPTNVTELQTMVIKLQNSNNELNKLLNIEKNNREVITKLVYEKVEEVQTNIKVVYEKVDNLEKPKTWTFGVGIEGSWNGRYSGIDSWRVAVHGLVFFKNMVYFGASVGIENYVSTQPSIGLMAGWKFN